MRALLLTLFLAGPALAWEPASPADVQARIGELAQAWAGKTAEQIAQDKVARARQQKPAWVERSAWKMELGPLTYYFAVGKAAFAAPAPSAAAAGSAKAAPAPSGRPLDWWFDEAAGALYTLVVEAR
jgi:hypothetical protein